MLPPGLIPFQINLPGYFHKCSVFCPQNIIFSFFRLLSTHIFFPPTILSLFDCSHLTVHLHNISASCSSPLTGFWTPQTEKFPILLTVHSVFFDERNIRKIPFSAVPSKPQIFHLQTLCQPASPMETFLLSEAFPILPKHHCMRLSSPCLLYTSDAADE